MKYIEGVMTFLMRYKKKKSEKSEEIQGEPNADSSSLEKSDIKPRDHIEQLSNETVLKKIPQKLIYTLEPISSNNKSSKKIERSAELLNNLRKLFINLIIIILMVILIPTIYFGIKKDFTIIEPFVVRSDFSDKGFTGEVYSNKLLDEINKISHSAKTTMESQSFVTDFMLPAWSDGESNLKLPDTAFSLRAILDLVREFFGYSQRRINGEISQSGDKIKITVRVNSKIPKVYTSESDRLEDLLSDSAKHVLKYTQPYILASYLYSKNKAECLEIIRYMIHHEPEKDDPWAYNLWGLVLLSKKEKKYIEEAIKKFERSIELDPSFYHPYANWGIALEMQNKEKEADEKFESAIKLNPQYIYAFRVWGDYLYGAEKYDEAIRKYTKIIELEPDSITYRRIGLALGMQGKFNDAYENFLKSVKLDPFDDLTYNKWGAILFKQEKFELSEEKFRKAIECNPENSHAFLNLAITLANLHKDEEAIKMFAKATKVDPNYFEAYYRWGELLEDQGEDYKGAVEKYKRVVELNSQGRYGKMANVKIDSLRKNNHPIP